MPKKLPKVGTIPDHILLYLMIIGLPIAAILGWFARIG